MKNMTIGKKLMLGFSTSLLITLAFGVLMLNEVGKLRDNMETTVTKTVHKLNLANDLESHVGRMRTDVRGFLLATTMRDQVQLAKDQKEFQAKTAAFRKTMTELRSLLVREDAKQAANRADAALNEWLPLVDQMLELCQQGKVQEANALRSGKQQEVVAQISAAIADLNKVQEQVLASDYESAQSDAA